MYNIIYPFCHSWLDGIIQQTQRSDDLLIKLICNFTDQHNIHKHANTTNIPGFYLTDVLFQVNAG